MASTVFPVTIVFKTLAGCWLFCARHYAGEAVVCKREKKVSFYPHGAYSLVCVGVSGSQTKNKYISLQIMVHATREKNNTLWEHIIGKKRRLLYIKWEKNLCSVCLYRKATRCWTLLIRWKFRNVCLDVAFYIMKPSLSQKTPSQTLVADTEAQRSRCHCPMVDKKQQQIKKLDYLVFREQLRAGPLVIVINLVI